MLKVSEFLEYAVSNKVEYSDDFWMKLESILKNSNSKNEFIECYKMLVPRIKKDNIMAAIGLITDIVTSLEVNLPELYPTLLMLLYKPYSYNYSVCHRIARLLIDIREGNINFVFNDIVNEMNPYDSTSIKISICVLYGNFEFNLLRSDLVTEYIQKVYKCLDVNKDDEGLKQDIRNFLLSKIDDSKYRDLKLKFDYMA